jgi:hypothetical protein
VCLHKHFAHEDSLPQLVVLLLFQQLDTDQRDVYFVRKIGPRWLPAELRIGRVTLQLDPTSTMSFQSIRAWESR